MSSLTSHTVLLTSKSETHLYFAEVGTELKALYVLGKHSTTELEAQPQSLLTAPAQGVQPSFC